MIEKFYLTWWHRAFGFSHFTFCCIILSSFLSISTVYAQLSGTYTIGGADGTYAGFAEAAGALQAQGVSGPVTFKVRPGTYEEQLSLGAFAGNSCTVPVIFEGTGVSAGQVILQGPEGASYVVKIKGADGISFRNISFTGTEKVIETSPGTDCFGLENNIVRSAGGVLVHARSGAAGSSHQHTYRNNTFLNGTAGILKENEEEWNPQAPKFDDGIIIERNEFRSQAEAAVHISGQQEFTISRNQMEVIGSGIVVSNSWYGKEISENSITAEIGDYQGTGITLNSGAAARITKNYIKLSEGGVGMNISMGKTSGNEIFFANNFIDVRGYDARGHNYFPISNLVGVNITGNHGNKIKIYHNTVRVSGYSENVPNYTFSASGESNSLHILNNVFANNSYGTTLLIGRASDIAEMDYNNLNDAYADLFARLGGKDITTLAQWQSTTGFDEHSINVNPYHPQDPNEAMIGAGTYLEEVPEDIYGQIRNNPPTIGAVEDSDLGPALSGVYTIGGEASHFATFAEAVAVLERVGVQDSVLFKVQPGEYHEQLNITNLRDEDVSITFEGAGGDSTDVVLQYEIDNVLTIRNSRNITFRNMTFSSGLSLSSSSGLLFENNVIKGGVNAYAVSDDTYRNNYFIELGIDKNSEEYNQTQGYLPTDGPVKIEGNTFEIIGPAISLYGQDGINITRNIIMTGTGGANGAAIWLENSSDVEEISHNSITSEGQETTGIWFGGFLGTEVPAMLVNNKILLPDGGTGINFYYSIDSRGPVSLVANNMISINADSSSTGIAIYNSGAGINFIHNSIYLYGDGPDSRVFYFDVDQEEPVNVHFKNNIFSNLAGGLVFYGKFYEDIKRLASSDYNNLYTNGETFANWEDQIIQDLSQWQVYTGFDEHSLAVDPQFESAESLIPGNSALFGAGTETEAVNTDFYGNTRNSPPAIGAAEAEEPEHQGPVAKAGRDKTLVLPDNSMILSGVASVENGRFVAFRWEKLSGPDVSMSDQNTANVKLTDLQEGEYVFRFSATDNKGRTASDEITLRVQAGEPVNQVPVVKAGRDKTISFPINAYVLHGTGHDPDGRFVAFRWEKVSGPSISMAGDRTANVRLSNFEPGEYVFRFSATDNEGATASDEMILRVKEENRPSVVKAGKDVSITTDYAQYFLSGTGYVPDGRFTAFRWEKVNGPSVTMSGQNTANLKISDFEQGEYTFRFSATDNRGITASDEVMVTVKGTEGSPAPLVAAATSVAAYPNTYRSYVNVEIKTEEPEEYQILVFDMLGKTIYQNSFVPDSFNSGTHRIEFSGQEIREGAYYIRVENQAGNFRKMLKIVRAN